MVATIRIQPSQADDLAAVCAMGSDALNRVAAAIAEAPITIKRERLKELVKGSLSDGDPEVLCRVIFGLSSIESRRVDLIDDAVAGITAALKIKFSHESRFSEWDRVAASLLTILKCKSVYFTAKAADISYDFERLLTACRIITSIRPVYTDARDDIVANTIVQTLRLDYVDSTGHSDSISFGLDFKDVVKLQGICKDALTKAEVAKGKLESWSMETVMIGDSK